MKKKTFYARPDEELASHLNAVGDRAAGFAAAFDATDFGKAAGDLHDVGKAEDYFQTRPDVFPDKSAPTKNRSKVDKKPHAHHGAMLALEKDAYPIAFAINAHHAGLHDRGNVQKRRVEFLPKAREAARRLQDSDASWSWTKIEKSLEKLQRPEWLDITSFDSDVEHQSRAVEFFTRMLFSALVDADRLVTQEVTQRLDSKGKDETANLRAWQKFDADELFGVVDKAINARAVEVRKYNAASPEVLKVRDEVVKRCLEAAMQARGLFTLTVPTGGGKTLASILFALAHARHHNARLPADSPHRFRRVIIVIPYLSIIEQTAKELKDIFGDDVVLEHHSHAEIKDASEEKPSGKKEEQDASFDRESVRRRLATENWDAPVVVTTSVQFFNSLFSRRPSQARKLHNIARSVIIFDEVQTLPHELLQPMLDVMNELGNPDRPYGSSLVFCTATQPALKADDEDFTYGLKDVRDIVPLDIASEHFRNLQRVEYKREGTMSYQEVAERIVQTKPQQVLAVVNTRQAARDLHAEVKQKLKEDTDGLFHLSTWMMPAHRQRVLEEVRRRLKDESKPCCILISTQCIEAGVDVDFPELWRAFAPYDSIVQAAGRCNRHGLLPKEASPLAAKGIVHIFHPEEEKIKEPSYVAAMSITKMLERTDAFDPENPESFTTYFRWLYDAVVPDDCAIQRERQAWHYEVVNHLFNFTDDDSAPVLVMEEMDETGKRVPTQADELLKKAKDRARGQGKTASLTLDEWRKVQSLIVNLPRRNRACNIADLQRDGIVQAAFGEESGLYVWCYPYRGGLQGTGLDFEGYTAEEQGDRFQC